MRLWRGLGLLALAALSGASTGKPPATTFRSLLVPGEDFELRPESERPLENLVLGLLPQGSEMLAIPGVEPGPGSSDPHAVRLRQELNAINVEVDHGRLFATAPARARIFVAVPDRRKCPEASGHEEEDFRWYLTHRAGWSEEEVGRRVRFFEVEMPVLFPRDLSEILGVDAKRRLVLGLGRDADPLYAHAIEQLVALFPDSFRLVHLRGVGVRHVNTEGGDVALVWTPEGRVALLIGRHRVLRFLSRRHGEDLTGKPVSREGIEEARAAFRSAFFGVEVLIAGEEALQKPQLGCEELFHADMVVSIMRGKDGAVAFVPTYAGDPVDAVTHRRLPDSLVVRAQTEYDLVAAQMARRGYAVVRLPFADHPVRGPANATPYVDSATGQPWLLLGRYPEHIASGPGAPIPLFPLQQAMDDLTEKVLRWRKGRREKDGRAVDAALVRVWKEWDRNLAISGASFDAQRRLIEEQGIRVRAVPLIPSGEGGLHCLLLR